MNFCFWLTSLPACWMLPTWLCGFDCWTNDGNCCLFTIALHISVACCYIIDSSVRPLLPCRRPLSPVRKIGLDKVSLRPILEFEISRYCATYIICFLRPILAGHMQRSESFCSKKCSKYGWLISYGLAQFGFEFNEQKRFEICAVDFRSYLLRTCFRTKTFFALKSLFAGCQLIVTALVNI